MDATAARRSWSDDQSARRRDTGSYWFDRSRTMILSIAAAAGRSGEHDAWKRCCTCVASSRAIPCTRPSAAMRPWLGSERARWPLLSERLSAAAGPGRKTISALRSRRPLSRAVRAWRRPRCQGWPMLPKRDGAAAISAGASTILRRTVRPTPASGPVLLSGLSYGRRSSATASATTATSEAMVYGFGSHPSGA